MYAAIPFPNIDPAVFTLPGFELFGHDLGPFPLRWYALAYIAGLVIGWRYMVSLVKNESLWQPKQRRLSPIQCDDFLFWATLGVILGGRLGYILFYATDTLWTNPLAILQIWEGGMSFHGGLIGVLIAVVYFSRTPRFNEVAYAEAAKQRASEKKPPDDQRDKYVQISNAGWVTKEQDEKLRKDATQTTPLLTLGDIVATATPVGLFFGRIANFINGELWGRHTDLPWGMIFPHADGLPRHPSQLYEAALEGIVLFSLLWFTSHRLGALKRPGLNAGVFLLCYGLFRALLENVRQPDAHMPAFPLGLTMGMMLSLPMIAIGAWLIWRASQGAAVAKKA